VMMFYQLSGSYKAQNMKKLCNNVTKCIDYAPLELGERSITPKKATPQ
jgi:hypothetical protein